MRNTEDTSNDRRDKSKRSACLFLSFTLQYNSSNIRTNRNREHGSIVLLFFLGEEGGRFEGGRVPSNIWKKNAKKVIRYCLQFTVIATYEGSSLYVALYSLWLSPVGFTIISETRRSVSLSEGSLESNGVKTMRKQTSSATLSPKL